MVGFKTKQRLKQLNYNDMKTSFKVMAASIAIIVLTMLSSIVYNVFNDVYLDLKSLQKVFTIEISILVLSGMYAILEEVFKK